MRKINDVDLPPVDLHGAFMAGTDWSDTDLVDANFAGANLREARFQGSDMLRANLKGTDLRGADLREVDNLTPEQIAQAIIDDHTKLPSYLATSPHAPDQAPA